MIEEICGYVVPVGPAFLLVVLGAVFGWLVNELIVIRKREETFLSKLIELDKDCYQIVIKASGPARRKEDCDIRAIDTAFINDNDVG